MRETSLHLAAKRDKPYRKLNGNKIWMTRKICEEEWDNPYDGYNVDRSRSLQGFALKLLKSRTAMVICPLHVQALEVGGWGSSHF
jgi:hypothetical protein